MILFSPKESCHKTVCSPSAKTWRPPHSSSPHEKNKKQTTPLSDQQWIQWSSNHAQSNDLSKSPLIPGDGWRSIWYYMWRVTDTVTKWQGEEGRDKSYLNVDVGGSFFITSTIFDSSPLLPRHISCLSTNLHLFIGILTSALTHTHILLCCWSQEEHW